MKCYSGRLVIEEGLLKIVQDNIKIHAKCTHVIWHWVLRHRLVDLVGKFGRKFCT